MVIQPNISIQTSDWDALAHQMTVYDLTLNFLMDGKHGRKLSLGYQYRSIFDVNSVEQKDYKAMEVIQLQVSLK